MAFEPRDQGSRFGIRLPGSPLGPLAQLLDLPLLIRGQDTESPAGFLDGVALGRLADLVVGVVFLGLRDGLPENTVVEPRWTASTGSLPLDRSDVPLERRREGRRR